MALPTDNTPAVRARYAALAEALLAQFPGRITALDCGPRLGVVPTWASPPTQAETDGFNATVNAWDWTEQPTEKLERLSGLDRLRAAVVLRLSASWTPLSPQNKARVQAILDDAGVKIVAALTGAFAAPTLLPEDDQVEEKKPPKKPPKKPRKKSPKKEDK